MRRYAVGFLIDTHNNVLLIRKNRPEWQAGKLNGIGGKVEEGELPIDAMNREMFEETDVSGIDWEQYATLREDGELGDYELYVFRSFVPSLYDIKFKSKTDEIVNRFSVLDLHNENIIPSARWFIHMAYDPNISNVEILYQ